jgi:hypothetical protein
MSVQDIAVASQKFTSPTVTGVVPAVTVAVNVTTLPDVTVETALPPEVTVKVVTVAAIATVDVTAISPAMSRTRRRITWENVNMSEHLIGWRSRAWESPRKFTAAPRFSHFIIQVIEAMSEWVRAWSRWLR